MEQPDWNEKPLRELMRHIVRRHHGYLRVALPEVHGRMQRVFAAGGGQAAERPLGRVFAEMWDEMDLHLEKEETILFPYIERLEAAREAGLGIPAARSEWGENPLGLMEDEHASAIAAMETMRRLAGGYEGCAHHGELMAGLEDLRLDLRVHIHLENNLLFPRVRRMM